jgi:HSP20 family molecular chaperone IbpA
MFRVIDLPCEVVPSKGHATFNDGRLEVVMPKAARAESVRVEANRRTSVHESGE